MKRFVALVLAGSLAASIVLFFPLMARAHDMDECYRNWDMCRERALTMKAGVIRTTIVLTTCDLGLGKCILNF